MKFSNSLNLLLVFFAITSIASQAHALPISSINVGDKAELYDGAYGTTNGGEFRLDILDKGLSNDFVSFCLEKSEYINFATPYKVQNISDAAIAGGGGAIGGQDPISDATKWVFWQYMTDGFGTRDNTLADYVQKTIWWLEDEITSVDASTLSFINSNNIKKDGTYLVNYNVKVLNLVDSCGILKQSQLIGEPVPEPATMLLFGAGLAGLAGAARRKRK